MKGIFCLVGNNLLMIFLVSLFLICVILLLILFSFDYLFSRVFRYRSFVSSLQEYADCE